MIAILGSGHRLHKRAVIHKVGNARFIVRVGVLVRAIPGIDRALCPLKLGADRAARRYVAPRAVGIFKLGNKGLTILPLRHKCRALTLRDVFDRYRIARSTGIRIDLLAPNGKSAGIRGALGCRMGHGVLRTKTNGFSRARVLPAHKLPAVVLSIGGMGGIARSSARKLHEIARGFIGRIIVIRFAAVHIVLNACLGKHEVHFVVLCDLVDLKVIGAIVQFGPVRRIVRGIELAVDKSTDKDRPVIALGIDHKVGVLFLLTYVVFGIGKVGGLGIGIIKIRSASVGRRVRLYAIELPKRDIVEEVAGRIDLVGRVVGHKSKDALVLAIRNGVGIVVVDLFLALERVGTVGSPRVVFGRHNPHAPFFGMFRIGRP